MTLPEDDHLNGFKRLADVSKPRGNVESISQKVNTVEIVLYLVAKFGTHKAFMFSCSTCGIACQGGGRDALPQGNFSWRSQDWQILHYKKVFNL